MIHKLEAMSIQKFVNHKTGTGIANLQPRPLRPSELRMLLGLKNSTMHAAVQPEAEGRSLTSPVALNGS